MNCDNAFDALTDSASANQAELAEHLLKCPRCRELKQVLEPALTLLGGDLPTEPAMPTDLANERRSNDEAFAFQKSFLSVEAIGVAEAAAARLTSPGGSRSVARLSGQRISGRVAQGILCAALGGLAVFCIGLWTGKSDVAPQTPLVPEVIPAGVCTRNAVPQKGTKTPANAQTVILSCVACHLRDPQRRGEGLPTSLFQPPRRPATAGLLVRSQKEVVNAHGPVSEAMVQCDCSAAGDRLGNGSARFS